MYINTKKSLVYHYKQEYQQWLCYYTSETTYIQCQLSWILHKIQTSNQGENYDETIIN